MTDETLESKAQNLIKELEDKEKQKEEKMINTKTSRAISKINTENNFETKEDKELFIKQNTVVNKNIIKRSNSMSSSDSDSSPHDNSDDEKKEEKKIPKDKRTIKNKLKKSSASVDSELNNLMSNEDPYIKLATLVSCIICITTTSLNIIISLINDKLTLTFSYSKNDNSPNGLEEIVMNRTMIYILLIIIILFNLGLFIVVLLNNDKSLTTLLYNNLNWYFVLTQLALGFQFLITLIWSIDLWTINVCLSVSMLAILIIAFYFAEIKDKKNLTACTFIFIYMYISVLFSFIAYITLFNISCILMENVGQDNENSDSKDNFNIIVKLGINIAQFVLSIIILSYYKDIFFSLTSAYIESAVFVHLNTKFEDENIALLVLVIVIIVGCLIMICYYGKKAFGYENRDISNEFNNELQA